MSFQGTTSNVATPIYALQEASPNIATPVYTWPFTQTWPSLNLTNLNTALWNQIQASANLIQGMEFKFPKFKVRSFLLYFVFMLLLPIQVYFAY